MTVALIWFSAVRRHDFVRLGAGSWEEGVPVWDLGQQLVVT